MPPLLFLQLIANRQMLWTYMGVRNLSQASQSHFKLDLMDALHAQLDDQVSLPCQIHANLLVVRLDQIMWTANLEAGSRLAHARALWPGQL